MEKMNLPLKQFLTLVGPATRLIVVGEETNPETDDEPLFTGKAAKMRDKPELLDREVKMIQPVPDVNGAAFYIWIY